MSEDILLYGLSETELYQKLLKWHATVELHEFPGDFHRLQVEYWIWLNRHRLCANGQVFDISPDTSRSWLGEHYQTLGLRECDVIGDICDLSLSDNSVGAIICTEVLEHCANPFKAVEEMRRVLKPGGLLFITAPFLWPWHGTSAYDDYWRFTDAGWKLLLHAYQTAQVEPIIMTDEGKRAYDMLRRFECLGHRRFTKITTGYLVEAVK